MYTPTAFQSTDLGLLDALVAADAFVTLVTTDGTGAIAASHLPVLYRRASDVVVLEGHWARPNPQAHQGETAMAIVHGPHAYVSPGWYPDHEAAARVPTWNYAAAHLYGRLERFDDAERLGDLVGRMADYFEAGVGGAWRYDHAREGHRTQLRGIVGFRFDVERIELKAKLNQNHPAANRRAVITALQASNGEDGRAVAAMMQTRIP